MAGRKILAAAAALMMFVGILALPVNVRIAASADAPGRITIECGTDGMEWDLYEISRVTDDGTLEPVETFKDFPIPTFLGFKEEIQTLAYTLENYITYIHPDPVRSGTADSSGKVIFADLEEGWYEAVPKKLRVGNTEYFSSSVMVCVTAHHLYNDYWGTDVTARPKSDHKEKTESSKKTVIIQYEPDPEKDPPDKIVTVIIYRDGTPYEQVILDETNNWTYVVPDVPDDDAEWVIIQKDTPDDTYPLYDKETTVIEHTPTDIITVWNKKETDRNDPPPVTDVPDITKPSVTSISTESGAPQVTDVTYDDSLQFPPVTTVTSSASSAVTTTRKDTPVTTVYRTPPQTDDSLPQTGQLWWPVPVLTASGLMFTVIGMVIRRKDQR